MVCSFPRSRFVLFWFDFSPHFSFPVKNVDGIEPLFIVSSSSKDDYLFCLGVVADGAVRSRSRALSCGFEFCPLFLSRVVGPEIVHVIGV